jgi:hypothetical protein
MDLEPRRPGCDCQRGGDQERAERDRADRQSPDDGTERIGPFKNRVRRRQASGPAAKTPTPAPPAARNNQSRRSCHDRGNAAATMTRLRVTARGTRMASDTPASRRSSSRCLLPYTSKL